jgi:hypothetical protein
MILIVGTASALLSWNGLTSLGIQAGFPIYLAWLLPVSIDGMLVLGSALVLHSTLTEQKTWFGWLMITVGVLLSIFGNVASVDAHDFQSQVVHSIPPSMLFLSVEGLTRVVRYRISVTKELIAVAEKEAAREAKKQERQQETEKLAQARKEQDNKVLLSASKRGGKKTSEADPEVAEYKNLLETLSADASKVHKVESILRRFPEARTTHIALAMDADSRQMGTTVMRAKKKLLAEAGHTEPNDAFQEIVKGLEVAN